MDENEIEDEIQALIDETKRNSDYFSEQDEETIRNHVYKKHSVGNRNKVETGGYKTK